MHEPSPHVTCLLVTRGIERLAMLERSLACYLAQSYLPRDLLVVAEHSPRFEEGLESCLAPIRRAVHGTDVAVHWMKPGDGPLGRLRNLAVSRARGPIVCQWDDDDIHHPHRIERQVRRLLASGKQGCLLSEHFQWFMDTNLLYRISWKNDHFPGSLVCYREFLRAFPYPELPLAEDSAVRDELIRQEQLAGLSGEPHLYVYTFHGSNSWSREHHASVAVHHNSVLVAEGESAVRDEFRRLAHGSGDARVGAEFSEILCGAVGRKSGLAAYFTRVRDAFAGRAAVTK